jgi:hypothetical protein
MQKMIHKTKDKKRESAIHAYATFVTGYANIIAVDKAW